MKKAIVIYTVLILMSLMNSGCSQEKLSDLMLGPPEDPRRFTGVDAELLPYVHEYEKLTRSEVSGISIGFNIQQGAHLGTCYIYTDKYKKFKSIEIDPEAWGLMSELRRKALIFHELEHCVQEKMYHINDERADGCAFSLMHWALPSDLCLEVYKDDYMFNMFR